MRGLLNYDNPFMSTLETIINLVILSVLWVIFCIPVFTIGASTTALYYSVQKWLKNERGYAWTCFWDSFKANFKQATLVHLLFLAIEFLLITDLYTVYFLKDKGVAKGAVAPFFIVILVIVVVYAFWYFASLARFKNTTRQTMKNAGMLLIRHWPISIYILAILALAAVILYIGFYFILAVPVLTVWLISLATEKVFRKYMSDEDKKLEDELNMNGYGDKKRIL